MLADGARENHKGTWTELKEVLDLDQRDPQPIPPLAELRPVSTPAQIKWLQSLSTNHDRVVIDIVRGWNRVQSLGIEDESTLIVHLVRDPANWVSAHLLPSGKPTFRRRFGDSYRKASFFNRRGFYDNYQYERIIDAALDQNHTVFDHVRLSNTQLKRAPAYQKLLAFWWGANVAIQHACAKHKTKSLLITLADFTASPRVQIERIATATGWDLSDCSTSLVRESRDSFGASSPAWSAAVEKLGLPDEILDLNCRDAVSIGSLLRSAQTA